MENEDYQSLESKSSESLIENPMIKDSFDKKVIESLVEDEVDSLSSEEYNTEIRVKNYRYSNNDEKLSEVNEEPEDMIAELKVKLNQDNGDIVDRENNILTLRERISSLNGVILSLRNEFIKEVDLWRKEREEYQLIKEKNDLIAIEEATAAARAAAKAYAAESPLSNELKVVGYNSCEMVDVNPEETLSELTILEYEKKLAKYQDALAFAQAEKRYNMRRQLAANTYRKKLIEVERLCDEELEKIQENANSLKPLKKIVSQWYSEDRCGGDADKITSDNDGKLFLNNRQNLYSNTLQLYGNKNSPDTGNFQIELNIAHEMFEAKFNVDEISREFSLTDNIIKKNGNKLSSNDNDETFLQKSVNPLDSIIF